MSIETILNYSPNFDLKKRKNKQIKFIIFHYTGMKKEIDSINKLTNYYSKVSSHYLIRKNGEILTLVPEQYIAWHAGVSKWKSFDSINKYSIGIEISNSGHDYNYTKFNDHQIKSVLKLSEYLIKKYKIKRDFILGHSDIAPERKIDPGEKFPWQYLSKRKIGYWHTLDKKILLKLRKQKVSKLDKKNFLINLNKIGYKKNPKKKIINLSKCLQVHFKEDSDKS